MFKESIKRLKLITPFEIFAATVCVGLLVFIVKYFGIKEDYRNIRVEVIRKNWVENYDPYGYRAPYWLSDKLKVGQTEKNSVGKNIAQVVRIENYIKGSEEAEVYLTLKVQAVLNKRTGRYTFKDKPMDLGSQIELSLDTANVLGQIVDDNAPLSGYPTKNFEIKVRGRNVDPSLLPKIVPGIKMYERSSNQVIAEFTDVKIEDSSLQPLTFDQEKYLYTQTNRHKDVVITAKITAYQMDGRWYFSGHQNIVNNSQFWFYSNELYLYELSIEDVHEL